MSEVLFNNIDNTYSQELPADPILENHIRQVSGAAFSYAQPRQTSNPFLLHASIEVAELLGLAKEQLESKSFLKVITGNSVHPDTQPYAMCYGGHQFGNWAGQLGDGRAINLFEVVNNDQRWALQLKGAGPTPYSRSADGLAVLRSSIREYLCSESMYHLGVPTTRALSLSLTGDQVLRDMMYDGNTAYEKGAVVCRVAPSFIRFGNFQIFAARKDHDNLRLLADYTIKHFFKNITATGKEKYALFFKDVVERTLDMIIHWQRVGFVHGVMNTDNLSILGLTIDYGPYGWLEDYDHNWTPNTTDSGQRRYRFGQQPNVALWNLAQLANALFPLIEEQEPFIEALDWYKNTYADRYFKMMASKLGLDRLTEPDIDMINDLEEVLQLSETDMTIFFRNVSTYSKNKSYEGLYDLIAPIEAAFYKPDEITGETGDRWEKWIATYLKRISDMQLSDDDRAASMNRVNPKYVLRNYMAQMIIEETDKGDYSMLSEVYEMLKNPYDEASMYQNWFSKRPEWARHKVGCSMLSCSS